MKTPKNKKEKILIVSDYFYPHWTGIAKSFFYLVKAIERDFLITILTVKHARNLKKEENLFSAKIKREDYIFKVSRSKYSLKIIFSLGKIVHSFDVIIINSPCSNILFFTIIAKVYKKKLLIYHQGDLILPGGILDRVTERVFDFFTIFSFFLADGISTNTDDYGRNSRVMKPFMHKFTPLLLPVYLSPNVYSSKKIKNELIYLKEHKKILFGFGGRFVQEKGFDILFQAIPLVIKEIPNAHFVFAGDIDISYENFYVKNKHLLKNVQEYITFVGLLEEKDLLYFYSQLDFVIISSRSDCFPLFQAEAMLSGVPSIVSDIPGARYLVKHTGFGVLFKKGDFEDLAKKIIHSVKNRKKIMEAKKNVFKILNNKKNVKKIKAFITK